MYNWKYQSLRQISKPSYGLRNQHSKVIPEKLTTCQLTKHISPFMDSKGSLNTASRRDYYWSQSKSAHHVSLISNVILPFIPRSPTKPLVFRFATSTFWYWRRELITHIGIQDLRNTSNELVFESLKSCSKNKLIRESPILFDTCLYETTNQLRKKI